MQLTAPAPAPDRPAAPAPAPRDADGMAVASFVLGLARPAGPQPLPRPDRHRPRLGVALWRGTARRGRALLGLGLGVADLLVLLAFMQMDSTLSWSF